MCGGTVVKVGLPGMLLTFVIPIYNPALLKQMQENWHEFKANLSYRMKTYHFKKERKKERKETKRFKKRQNKPRN